MEYIEEYTLRDMVRNNTDDPLSHFLLGDFLRKIGKYKEARKEFLKALDIIEKLDRDIIIFNVNIRDTIENKLNNLELSPVQIISTKTRKYETNVIINSLKDINFNNPKNVKILDLGAHLGVKTYSIAKYLRICPKNVTCVDIVREKVEFIRKSFNFNSYRVDIENEELPFDDKEFDLVICNQVIEHLKNINLPLSEIYRVLKDNGFLLIGVPNLAAFHNRILILLGKQPVSMKLTSSHIRGFTPQGLKEYLERNNFGVIKFKGNGFYPFPIEIGRFLAKIFPTFSVFIYFLVQKKENDQT
ncbi:MAG: hypothetical protein DRO95_03685 [Candidatus Altiarchaeales archaeon]|nr:MAG: hypothetical protein DRO95_03685 [Candidatus Altiarchaeales archaeon]